MKLWLVRHAEPVVQAGLCYGRLDVAAEAQATAHGARSLAAALPERCELWASPLRRCGQLVSELMNKRPDLHVKTDERLAEMDFGYWEGQSWDAIAPHELKAWTDDFAAYRTGAVGESVNAFMARVGAAFDDAVARSRPADTTQVWITHAGVIRAARLIASGKRRVTQASAWPLEAPGFGQWCTLDLRS